MENVIYHKKERIAYITLNRPAKRNALNYEIVELLKQYLKEAESDDEVKVVILKGEGEAFCAGADLEYLQQLQKNNYEENLSDSTHLMELYKKIYNFKKIVIAQVNGHAIAGGCGLVTVCDFAFAIPEANFGYTEVRIGFVPAIVMFFLLRKIGEQKTKQLLLSGDIITAEEAKHMGIITQIVAEDALEATVWKFAQHLCTQNSTASMEITKSMIAEIQTMDTDAGLKYAAEQNAMARATTDCRKGIAAFLNKEKIKW